MQDLMPAQRALVKAALKDFLEDLPTGRFRSSLRVKRLQGHPGVFEMTWEYHDGRALFRYGNPGVGEPDVVWLRIGTHAIFNNP
jgi:hypothetical protein